MIDKDVIFAKASKVNHHLNQNCIDIAVHIISDEELGIAGSTNEMFFIKAIFNKCSI